MIWHPKVEFQHTLGYNKVNIYGGDKAFTFWFLNLENDPTMQYVEECLLTFSCGFSFKDYPFDSHVCKMEYGDQTWTTDWLTFNSPTIVYDDKSHSLGDDPIIIENSNLPFTFHLSTLPAYEKKDPFDTSSYSFTGLVMNISRKSYVKLLSGYYYPMTAFALLSMISYLIKPDVVSNTRDQTKCFNISKYMYNVFITLRFQEEWE